jgi:hypothetical protein
MSEKVFALLLRLFPPDFRKNYGDEAMQLYRDRARDERGLVRTARLWRDLLADLAIALPSTYRSNESAMVGADAQQFDGGPVFRILQSDVPSACAIFYGCVLSLLVFGLLFVWMGHGRNYRLLQALRSGPERTSYAATPEAGLPLRQLSRDDAHGNRAASTTETGGSEAGANDGGRNGFHATRVQSKDVHGISGAGAAQPRVKDATAAMIEAITTHQVVMFGETHADKQEYEWLCKLLQTPDFADRVDDIVVEFGNSLYQRTVDRYIAGEDIPEEQVQKAWRNVIGAVGPVSPVYGWLYKAVRESNRRRHGKHQIRLLLGDPYGDWDKINNAEDLGPYLAHRDEWYAQVVKDEVLVNKDHALLIMGAGHFLRRNGPGLVEREIRAAGGDPYLVVLGTNAVGSYDDLDRRFDAWSLPAIVPLAGNWVGALPAMPVVTGGEVAPNPLKMADVADALLYVGPRDALTAVNVPRSELDDTEYGKEVNRRLKIQTGRTMEFSAASEEPQFRRPAQQTVSSGIHALPPAPPKSVNDPLPPRPPSQ